MSSIGVSVLLCCHNSTQRLPQTLAHLEAQRVQNQLQWEVILIDNASTDDTSNVALSIWSTQAPAPLRVVHEPRLGLSYARQRGLVEAKGAIVTFIDDDNWICSDWVNLVWEVMSHHPEIGACGSNNEPVVDVELPQWFEKFHRSYAVGPQGDQPGDITWEKGVLFGAGLTIRKTAWQQLIDNGFHPLLLDRTGNALSSGGDYELCLALRLAGWQLWYEPRLRLKHYLPAHRLQWSYLRRLLRGVGLSSPVFDSYHFALANSKKRAGWGSRLAQTWQYQLLRTILQLLKYHIKPVLASFLPFDVSSYAMLLSLPSCCSANIQTSPKLLSVIIPLSLM